MSAVERPEIKYKRMIGERLTLTPIEAAAMLGVSRATLYMLMKTGRLKAYKLDLRTFLLPADLKKFLSKLPLYGKQK